MNQIRAGIVLNYVLIVLNIVVGLLYTPYMLRTMGQSEYGLYSLVASVISYLTVLDLGFGNAIVRYTAKFRAEGKQTEQYEMFGMFLVVYLIIGAVALFAGLGVCCNVDALFADSMTVAELDKARVMLLLLTANMAVTFPLSVYGSIITAYEKFVFQKGLNIARTILNTIVMICLLTMGYKAIAMVVVQTVFNILTLLINYIYCKRKLHIKVLFRNFRWEFFKEVAIYSFWIFLNVVMDRFYWNTGQFILGIFSGTVAVATFALSIQLVHMYVAFSTAVNGVFLPKVSGMVAQNDDRTEISNMFIKVGRIQYLVMGLVLSGFVVFGRQFIALWAGEGYEEVYWITLILFAALFIPLIQNLGIVILQARNQMKFRSLLYIVIATVGLAMQVLLAQKYGGLGCAFAIATALLLGQGVIMNIYYKKKQGIDIARFWKEILKMSIVTVAVGAVAMWTMNHFECQGWMMLLAMMAAYSVVYLVLSFACSLNSEERSLVLNPIRRILNKIR
ncbi:MAG: oligosaccharide flippase family protein [Alistipes sp.]|nr:oligosaccharide flippase family protein [Alistipes sp.]